MSGSDEEPTAVSGTRRRVKELVDGTLRVEIDIDPMQKRAFLKLLPEIDMPIAIAPLATQRQAVTQKEESVAHRLHRIGYFRNPRLWERMEAHHIYTQAAHVMWIRTQPCAARALPSATICAGDIVGHHVTGAALPVQGTGGRNPRKPLDWFLVPLCDKHHQTWAHGTAERGEKEGLRDLAVATTAEQIRAAMKRHLGLDSLSELTADHLTAFEEQIGL